MVLEDTRNIFTPGMHKNALRAFIMSFPSFRMQGYKFTKCYQYSHWMIKTCKSLAWSFLIQNQSFLTNENQLVILWYIITVSKLQKLREEDWESQVSCYGLVLSHEKEKKKREWNVFGLLLRPYVDCKMLFMQLNHVISTHHQLLFPWQFVTSWLFEIL